MPLKHGYSRATFHKNVKEMRATGHPMKQALAAAYRVAADSARAAHVRPSWLKPSRVKRR